MKESRIRILIELILAIAIIVVGCFGIRTAIEKHANKITGEITLENYTDYLISLPSIVSGLGSLDTEFRYSVSVRASSSYSLENLVITYQFFTDNAEPQVEQITIDYLDSENPYQCQGTINFHYTSGTKPSMPQVGIRLLSISGNYRYQP